jgi:hypothetical protein
LFPEGIVMSLIRDFERAGLRLEVPLKAIVDTSASIFQMDIRRERGREWFRLWKGQADNVVRVADADRDLNQLVLMVQEPSRTFTEKVSRRMMHPNRLGALVESGEVRVLKEWETQVLIERTTPESLRRYLCGLDERHYFVAQVQGGTTVRDAHRLLKPDAVREAERGGSGRLVRQGEWFFMPLKAEELQLLVGELKRKPHLVRRRVSLGGNGRPHVADAVVVLDAERVYARGAVRHPDHKTLVLSEWRRVHRNTEVQNGTLGANGVFWID